MAESMIRGLLEKHLVPPSHVLVTGPRRERRADLAKHFGVKALASNADGCRRCCASCAESCATNSSCSRSSPAHRSSRCPRASITPSSSGRCRTHQPRSGWASRCGARAPQWSAMTAPARRRSSVRWAKSSRSPRRHRSTWPRPSPGRDRPTCSCSWRRWSTPAFISASRGAWPRSSCCGPLRGRRHSRDRAAGTSRSCGTW